MRSEGNRKWWGFTKTTDKNIQEELHRLFYRTVIGAARHSISCQQMITCQTAFSKEWRKWVPGGLWMAWSRVYIASRWGYVWVLHPQWPPDCIIGPFDISDFILLFIVNTIPVTSMDYRGGEMSKSLIHFFFGEKLWSKEFLLCFEIWIEFCGRLLGFVHLDFKILASNNQV